MKAIPVTANCRRSLDSRTHICFGISPFNSYFSEQRIQQLAAWGLRDFGAMHFFVPDVPSAFTLEALGYDADEAAYKARRQCQYLTNKIMRALSNLGIASEVAKSQLLTWPVLEANTRFLQLHAAVQDQFASDSYFRDACLEASRWVLERRVPDTASLTPDVLRSAVRYLLAELPLFLDSAGIANAESSIFVYHQCPDFIARLMRGEFSLKASCGQGFAIAAMPDLPPLVHKEPAEQRAR